MTQPTDKQRPPGFFKALWIAFIAFLGTLFKKSPSAAGLPIPATARSPKSNVNTNEAAMRPTSTVKVVHERISLPAAAWVKEPRPLKHRATTTAARSRAFSMARTSPPRRSRSVTPKLSHPGPIFHPPASPFPNISLSGIFATPPSSPLMTADTEIGHLTFSSPPVNQDAHVFSPGSPPPLHHVSPSSIKEMHRIGTSPSIRSIHSRSPHTPRMPTSVVVIRLDPGTLSPTAMSDGSFEVISLGDHRGFLGYPVKFPNVERLPSPWSPIGKSLEEDVWMSVDGVLMKAGGPVNDDIAQPADGFIVLKPAIQSSLAASSSFSTTSDLDGFDISAFVNLGRLGDDLPSEDKKDDAKGDPTKRSNVTEVCDDNRSTLDTQESHTPHKRRDTLPSVTRSQSPISYTSRAIKCLSTPLTKLDNVDLSHFRSTSSISSMAYEFRLGLLGDGRSSMTALENIISFLEQDSLESTPPRVARGPVQVPVAGLVEAV